MIFKKLNEEAILDLDELKDLENDRKANKILKDKVRYVFDVKDVFDKNKELVRDSIINFKGHSDPDINKFLDMLITIDNNNKYLNTMYQLYSSGEIDLKYFDNAKSYYDWASLNSFYDERSEDAIKYKARIFDIVSNPQKLRKFFSNTDNINIKDLYLDNKTVKKASLNNLKDKNGLFYQVSKWDSEEGQKTKEDSKVEKETLKNLSEKNKKVLNDKIQRLKNQLSEVVDDPSKWFDIYLEIEKLNDELHNIK